MGSATIVYDVSTAHWPQESFLVQLDPPIRRFNPVDGSPIDHEHVIVCLQSPANYRDQAGAVLFATNEAAEFAETTMTPIGRYEYGVLHSVLKQMGYEATN